MRKFKPFVENKLAQHEGALPSSTDRLGTNTRHSITLWEDTEKDCEEAKENERNFYTFYEEASQAECKSQKCQCLLLEKATLKLLELKLDWHNHKQVYDCRKYVSLPIPKISFHQKDFTMLDNYLEHGHLDYLHHSMQNFLSFYQPCHRACVVTTAEKQTWDSNVRNTINTAYKPLGVPEIVQLDNTKMRIMLVIRRCAFYTRHHAHHDFHGTLKTVRDVGADAQLDEKMIDQHQLSRLIEWTKISAAMHVSEGNEELLAKLCINMPKNTPLSHRNAGATRFDSLATLAIIEYLFPIRFLIFCPTA